MGTSMKCIMCGRYSGSGITILNRYICEECEQTLVNTNINDVDYDWYKNMLRDKIFDELLLTENVR